MASPFVAKGAGITDREAFSDVNETGRVIMSQVRSGILDTSDRYTTLVRVGGFSSDGTAEHVRASMMNP